MKHTYGRDCPCNPYIVSVGQPLETGESVTVVATEPTMMGMLLHVERDGEGLKNISIALPAASWDVH